ncbi:hypothetical protein ABZZ36_34770 [Actinacidiphila glaucinigra]|uniref:hypothetical protein n=1 Tax=Actinacidiphila glaucinigra TaxID=235986 RepID=UPI0033B86AB3
MPETSALDAVVKHARRVRVTPAIAPADLSDGEIVVNLSDRTELDHLRAAMAVESLPGCVCMCLGDVRFEFWDADARELGTVVLHHGATLRWYGWESDAVLADGRLLLLWLDDHGISGPVRQSEEEERRRAVEQSEQTHWLAAMPTALDALSAEMLSLSQTGESASSGLLTELRNRLERAFPDPTSRTLALLAWCGAGTGRYSGYPVHEQIPGLLLKDVPIAEIVVSLLDARADSRHDAGAVRHLVSWKGRRKQKRDIAALPESLRARLIRHAQSSGDRTTRARSERWLTPARARGSHSSGAPPGQTT